MTGWSIYNTDKWEITPYGYLHHVHYDVGLSTSHAVNDWHCPTCGEEAPVAYRIKMLGDKIFKPEEEELNVTFNDTLFYLPPQSHFVVSGKGNFFTKI